MWPLGYKYTNQGLRLSHLKGDDYNRARHVAQSCREHGGFYAFLANMERHISDPNDENEDREKDSQLYLTHLVDVGGFSLMVYKSLIIDETALLEETFDSDRDPDTQVGGEYWGNQHAEIDQYYNDSVSVRNSQIEIDLTSLTVGYDSCSQRLRHLVLARQGCFTR